jgi:hypothetical protein
MDSDRIHLWIMKLLHLRQNAEGEDIAWSESNSNGGPNSEGGST